jgi:hypothetical protein
MEAAGFFESLVPKFRNRCQRFWNYLLSPSSWHGIASQKKVFSLVLVLGLMLGFRYLRYLNNPNGPTQ